jgi:hypothetical protein
MGAEIKSPPRKGPPGFRVYVQTYRLVSPLYPEEANTDVRARTTLYLPFYWGNNKTVWKSTKPRMEAEEMQRPYNILWQVNSFAESYKRMHKKKLRGFSPQANYTDRATAACRRS